MRAWSVQQRDLLDHDAKVHVGALDGELPGLEGPSITAAECAVGIADALEADGFEFFVPADLQDHVTMKNADINGWIELMAALGRDKAEN